jgi:hypothetical protein
MYFCKRAESIWLALLLLNPLQTGNEIPHWRKLSDTLSRSFAMTLIQELMNQAAVGGLLNAQTIKRFSPAEIRETIQSLVATEQMALASALGDAGLSIYPNSEDMLAISSLLAMTNQDWQLAVEIDRRARRHPRRENPPFHSGDVCPRAALQPRSRARFGCGSPRFEPLSRAIGIAS